MGGIRSYGPYVTHHAYHPVGRRSRHESAPSSDARAGIVALLHGAAMVSQGPFLQETWPDQQSLGLPS